jgi:integrase
MMLGGGLRPSEACGMNAGNVIAKELETEAGRHLTLALLNIEQAYSTSTGKARLKTTKTRKSKKLQPVAGYPAARLLELSRLKAPDDALVEDSGVRMTPGTFLKYFKALVESSDVPYKTAKNMRHSYGTLMRSLKLDPKTMQDMMRHTSFKTTETFYLGETPELLEEAAIKLADAFDV